MSDHNFPSEHDAQPRPEDETAVIVTAPDGRKIGVAPLGTRCLGYWPGHSIHPIHARHGDESRDWVPARVLAVEGSFVEFATESGTWRRWNHNAAQLRRIAELPDSLPEAEAEWCERYWLLKVNVNESGYLLSLAESDEKACVFR